MGKTAKISKNDIITWYMNYVLEHGKNPKSIFAFAKINNFEEALFYQHFASFEAVESGIYKAIFQNTFNVLSKSEDFKTFDARNKLLSFYYTFFENLTANRSYVKHTLDKYKGNLKGLKMLNELKKSFLKFTSELEIEKLDIKNEQFEKFQNKALNETAWLQLLVTIKFWLEDSSTAFEKTDIFIEKSVNTTFDVLDVAPIKSVIDLGKFLFKEKFQMN